MTGNREQRDEESQPEGRGPANGSGATGSPRAPARDFHPNPPPTRGKTDGRRSGSGRSAVFWAALANLVVLPLLVLGYLSYRDAKRYVPSPASWEVLAARYEPPEAWLADGGERAVRSLRLPIEAERWLGNESLPGLYVATAPELYSPFRLAAGAPAELELAGLRLVSFDQLDPGALPEPPLFRLNGSKLTLQLGADAPPPGPATLNVRVAAGERGSQGWRVSAGEVTGDGWVLTTDAPVEIAVDSSAGGMLRWWTSVQVAGASAEEPTFRVFVDGVLAQEHTQTEALRHHRIRASGRTLRFEVEGPRSMAYGVLGAAVGSGGGSAVASEAQRRYMEGEPQETEEEQSDRRRANERPDLILFSCDTFRADNMRAYGGIDEVTPNLDRLAAEGTVFRRSWSSSSWTLPSHASLLYGVHPHQHGAIEGRTQPATSIPTLAMRLAAVGYRTVAITESVFVSRDFQMDRGFEVFQEVRDFDFERTLAGARALLEADDGRPTFLFVHTYRVHAPYRVSEQTRREHGERLEIRGDYDGLVSSFLPGMGELLRAPGEPALKPRDVFERSFERSDWYERFNDLAVAADAPGVDPGVGRGVVENLRRLYLGAVIDFDRSFGEFREFVEARGADNTCLIFTSDHGELFGEHDKLLHGRGTWDALLRVPLVFWGPGLGITARVVDDATTSADLPTTLCQLADVAPDRAWSGRGLMTAASGAPAYLFDCNQFGPLSGAVVVDELKLGFPIDPAAIDAGQVSFAFDLEADPEELVDLSVTRGPTLQAQLRARAGELLELLKSPESSGRAVLQEVDRARMEAMGYTGEE